MRTRHGCLFMVATLSRPCNDAFAGWDGTSPVTERRPLCPAVTGPRRKSATSIGSGLASRVLGWARRSPTARMSRCPGADPAGRAQTNQGGGMTMRGGRSSAFLTLGTLGLVVALSGCATFGGSSSSTQAPADPAARTAAAPAPTPVAAAPTPAPVVETAKPAHSSNGYTELAALADVRFRAGQVTVVKADHKILDSVARWLKENPTATVMIEGHADDRGSREENLAAGEKRAT